MSPTSLNYSLKGRYKLSPYIFGGILLLCLIILAVSVYRHYFGFWSVIAFISINPENASHTLFNLWSTLAIGTALITGAISFVDYYVKRELSTPLIGSILVAVALLDGFHLMLVNRAITLRLDYLSSVYSTWLISRIFCTLLLAFGTLYFIRVNKMTVRGVPRKNTLLRNLNFLSMFIASAIIAWFALTYKPEFLYMKEGYLLNFGVVPIAINLLWGFFILPYFHLRYPSIFSRLLVLSIIPGVCSDLAMCLHSETFDMLFNTSYFFRFISYAIPLCGISMNYIETIAKEKSIVYRLDNEIHERLFAQKELEKREALLTNAERIAHLGSWEFNIALNELKWSDEMFNIYGYKLGSVKPTMALAQSMIMPAFVDEVVELIRTTIRDKSSYNIEYQIRRPSGDVRYLLGQGNYLVKTDRLFGTVLDITELKEAERNLEVKVNELNRSNSELEQFAYIASHDLQEPLRKIKAFGDRLTNKFGNLLPPEGIDYIGRMTNASQRMQTLIDDLLTFSRVSRAGDNMEEVRLADIIKGVINDLEVAIEKKNAQLEVNVMHSVYGVPGQMRQLFQNLVSNALKFSKPGEQVKVEVSTSVATSEQLKGLPGISPALDYCRIIVKDNGIGFDKGYADKIFVLFHRLHTRNEYEGTGIGLAVCKKIVENHQGYILAGSEIGEGATFTIYIPLFKQV